MGLKLIKIYEAIGAKGGLGAKIELAVKTKIPSTQAAIAEDSKENIDNFKKAYKEITGEDYTEK